VPDWFVQQTSNEDGNPLAAWFANHVGKDTRRVRKWSQYLEAYHRHLHKFRGKPVRMLELGVQSGGSLAMWLDYFGENATAFGIDADPVVKVIEQDRPGRIRILIGDQGDPDFLKSVCSATGQLDFILDDASHIPWHQILGVKMLFPCLNPDGGIYMVEGLTEGSGSVPAHNDAESFLTFAFTMAAGVQLRNASASRSAQWLVQLASVNIYHRLVVLEKRANRHSFALDAGEISLSERTAGYMKYPRSKAEHRAAEIQLSEARSPNLTMSTTGPAVMSRHVKRQRLSERAAATTYHSRLASAPQKCSEKAGFAGVKAQRAVRVHLQDNPHPSDRYSHVVSCGRHTFMFSRRRVLPNGESHASYPVIENHPDDEWATVARIKINTSNSTYMYSPAFTTISAKARISHNLITACVGSGVDARLIGYGGRYLPFQNEHASLNFTRETGLRFASADVSGMIPAWNVSSRTMISGSSESRCYNRLRPAAHLKSSGCLYDGLLGYAYHNGRHMLYARANMAKRGGARFVQVTSSVLADSKWDRFKLLNISGVIGTLPSTNIYYFRVAPLGLSAAAMGTDRAILVALYPAVLGFGAIFLSLSYDGIQWTKPDPLLRAKEVVAGRTSDHPVAWTAVAEKNEIHVHVEHDVATLHRPNVPYHCVYVFDMYKLVPRLRALLRQLPSPNSGVGSTSFINDTIDQSFINDTIHQIEAELSNETESSGGIDDELNRTGVADDQGHTLDANVKHFDESENAIKSEGNPATAKAISSAVHEIVSRLNLSFNVQPRDGKRTPLIDRQRFEVIPPLQDFAVVKRSVPLEPDGYLTQLDLDFEANDTLAAPTRSRSADPRAKPEDLVVQLEHLKKCTSCENYKGAWKSMHAMPQEHTIDVGNRLQLFADDFLVERWKNTLRFVNRPKQRPMLWPESSGSEHNRRFGCPCSTRSLGQGMVELWHSDTPKEPWVRVPEKASTELQCLFDNGNSSCFQPDEHIIVRRSSEDGLNGWSIPVPITMLHKSKFKTFAVSSEDFGAAIEGNRTAYYAGFEADWGMACIAHSVDGINWRTLHSREDARSRDRKETQRLYGNRRAGSACPGKTASYLGRAADTSVVLTKSGHKMVVHYRHDFGTPGGWREIRGLKTVALEDVANMKDARGLTKAKLMLPSWYFDRLGKMERFRRQLYALSLNRITSDLWLGYVTVLEWGKDVSEPIGPDLPAFKRDTTNVYLVTSRDGVHIDDGWVYAHQPLIPKGSKQRDWNSGLLIPASNFASTETAHHLYFEARPGHVHHENRFGASAVIGVATWAKNRIVGLRPAYASLPSTVLTKPFRLTGASLVVDADIEVGGSTLAVEIVDAHSHIPVLGHEASKCVVTQLTTSDGLHEIQWKSGSGAATSSRIAIESSTVIQLRFVLNGRARLYGFQIR